MSYSYELAISLRRSPGALGGIFDNPAQAAVKEKIDTLEAKLASFNASWRASKLTDASMPTAFLVDLLSELLREVVKPFTDLRLKMLKDLSNVALTEEIGKTGASVDKYWGKLVPVMLDAIKKRQQGVQLMQVVIAGAPPGYTFVRYVNLVFQSVIDGYGRLMEFEDAKPWFLSLGSVTTGAIEFLLKAGQMVDQAMRVMASAGELIYKPIATAINVMDIMIKGTVVLGGAYLLWKVLK